MQVQVEFGEQRREPIRIVSFHLRAAIPKRVLQLVRPWFLRECSGEEAVGMQFPHRMQQAARRHPGIHGLRQESANLPAIFFLMRAKNAKRVAVGPADDRFQLFGSHAQLIYKVSGVTCLTTTWKKLSRDRKEAPRDRRGL
jgi:hypothetical protein